MSAGISLPTIAAWPLAARLSVAPRDNPWALLAVASDRGEAESQAFIDELASLLDAPVELVRVSSAQALIDIIQTRQHSALVIIGLDGFDADEWRRLDVNRSNLARTLPAVLVLDEAKVPAMLEHAPNLWSWLGGAAWRGIPETGLDDEQRTQRLSALRAHFGFDDAELVRRAEAGTLPPEPALGEWLVLIGRGDLVGVEET
jgi:hypothetical protein